MSRFTFRPATREDFAALTNDPIPFRIIAYAVEVDRVLQGVGGFGFPPSGNVIAFVHAAHGAHRYKVAFHRAGLMAMAEAKRIGLRRVIATVESKNSRAAQWLERLGFKRESLNGVSPIEAVWIWNDARPVN